MANPRSQDPLKLNLITMSQEDRDLYLRVVDGMDNFKDLGPLIHHFSNYRDVKKMLKWLIGNNWTGKNLLDLWLGRFNGSMLETGRWIIAEGNRDWKTQKIIAGEHFQS